MSHVRCLFFLLVVSSLISGAAAAQDSRERSSAALRKLSLEELGNIEVTSVSKSAEPLNEAAAAIYVIAHDDILRSGASSIPELLRLAPNLQVAQVSAYSYAITARGFNGTAANKLLVLIDGRSVYTPLYSGVFWDVQAVLIEDIDRIEVISGPGSTLWGPNAVNGVINIITRASRDTQGTVLTVGAGDFQNAARFRYGGMLGKNVAWRGYALGLSRDNTVSMNGAPLNDSWHDVQGGLRVDWRNGGDAVTLQGDVNHGEINQKVPADQQLAGHNLLGRWTRRFDESSELQVQAYYDYAKRLIPGGSGYTASIADLDIQHSFSFGRHHKIVWGGGYRASWDHFFNPPTGSYFSPAMRALSIGNLFIQDTVSATDRLELTFGTKIGNNTYTGVDAMPSGRLSWKLSSRQLLWAAVSRAVRTPARIDRDVYQNVDSSAGPILAIGGGPQFDDEELTAYELGYRTQIRSRASLSIATFYNDYDALRTLELSPTGTIPATLGDHSGFLPITFGNKMQGRTYGVEVWGSYAAARWWRLTAGYNALREHLRLAPDSLDVGGIAAAGNDPRHQASLRSSMDLPGNLHIDTSVRHVAALPNPAVPGYGDVDLRLGWQVHKHLELAAAGFNLAHKRHREFGTTSEVPRSVVMTARVTLGNP